MFNVSFGLALTVLAFILIGMGVAGLPTHDPAYTQGLDAWWAAHDSEDRRQACHLAERFGVEYTAETLAVQYSDDQDNYAMALTRHCS